jgi:hypothetical protein
MGVSFPALLTAEIVRYRAMAAAATPKLDEWQWNLLAHVLSNAETHRILTGDDTLPSGASIATAIDEWADGALDDDALRAGGLRRQAAEWSPPSVASVLMRLRP